MKKLIVICMAALIALSAFVGCSSDKKPAVTDKVQPTETATDTAVTLSTDKVPTSAPKVVINFEGIVTAVNENEISLENGKIVVLSEDTVFAGDRDTNNAVSEDIAVGNFIQGYTKDDPESDKLSADKIYCNTTVQPSGGKLMINFEGTVDDVDDGKITLENGQTVLVTDDTVFSIASGVVENVVLTEGYRIQGYTSDAATASEITASRIHIIAY